MFLVSAVGSVGWSLDSSQILILPLARLPPPPHFIAFILASCLPPSTWNFLVNLQDPCSLLHNPLSCKSQNDVCIKSSSAKTALPSVLGRTWEEEGLGLKSSLHYQAQLLFCPHSLSLARTELKHMFPIRPYAHMCLAANFWL